MDEPRIDRNVELDILSFWKKNQLRFPKLASMVCDVSSIPISTITSEFTFSAGEQVIDQFSSALKPDVVEALVCTKDWLYGDKGNIIYFYIHLLFSIHKTLLNFLCLNFYFGVELVLLQLDDLTEDIVNLDINRKCEDDPSSTDSFISSNQVS